MHTLNLSIFGYKTYIDEIQLNGLVVDLVDSIFDDSIFDSVTVLFILGLDRTLRIPRLCNYNGYGYKNCTPNWNATELPEGHLVRLVKSHRTGQMYNTLAALNNNRQILKDSDYILLLHDVYKPDGEYIPYDTNLSNINNLIKSDCIDLDKVANVWYDSSKMEATDLLDTPEPVFIPPEWNYYAIHTIMLDYSEIPF